MRFVFKACIVVAIESFMPQSRSHCMRHLLLLLNVLKLNQRLLARVVLVLVSDLLLLRVVMASSMTTRTLMWTRLHQPQQHLL